MAHSNHYLHRDHRKLNSETEWTDEDGQEWMIDTEEGISEVHRLTTSKPRSLRGAINRYQINRVA